MRLHAPALLFATCLIAMLLTPACRPAAGGAILGGSAPPRSRIGPTQEPQSFSGAEAMAHVAAQMAFGERHPGSPGHQATRDYIVERLAANGWEVEIQAFDYQGFGAQNLIGRANVGVGPIVILGAHYDTRRVADQTPSSTASVPGAVDGASGVAVLLELARVADLEAVPREIWLAFFDIEDNGGGGIPGWDWIAGSSYMAENLRVTPSAMVLVDMVGDADQQLHLEGNSDPVLQAEIWRLAAELGYDRFFLNSLRFTMIDDHVPFARKGIPAVDIIDFDYPYWHTTEDTLDKVSPDSLERVGHTLQVWLEQTLE